MIQLSQDFATQLPELTRPAKAAEFARPRVLLVNEPLAHELGLDPEWLASNSGLRFLLGRNQLPATQNHQEQRHPELRQSDKDMPIGPVAQAYAGHQFGTYSPLLGDGRAMLLGELTTPEGALVDLHLKGSGLTDFSRPGSDGLAGLGPVLREYILSEVLHSLGIPTTRALAVVVTDTPVMRTKQHRAAVLIRVASSHVRVGSFQLVAQSKNLDLLNRLTRFSLARHYPENQDTSTPGLTLFTQVSQRQAELVADWMSVGFIHGVMNTDNMTISGETIDYGPCAFMDTFDPATVFSSIDHQGRYAYARQPGIAQWNLTRFAEALLPLIQQEAGLSQEEAIERVTALLSEFSDQFSTAWLSRMSGKLGLNTTDSGISPHPNLDQQHQDHQAKHQHQPPAGGDIQGLVNRLTLELHEHRVDFTDFFAGLHQIAATKSAPPDSPLRHWYEDWLELQPSPDVLRTSNPVHIARNHLVEQALTLAEAGDLEFLHDFVDVLRRPFEAAAHDDRFSATPPPEYAHYVTFCGT